eukprot:SAG31_NODE_10242_length_1165_cov_1.389306_1_plen_292_part_10
MRILPFLFGEAEGHQSGFENVTDVSSVTGGGAVAYGYVRVRLEKRSDWQWGVYNKPKLQFKIPQHMVGKYFSLARIRVYSTSAGQQRADNWQTLAIQVEELKPVPRLPKRLHTSYCWSNFGMIQPKVWKALCVTALLFRFVVFHLPICPLSCSGFNTLPNSNATMAHAHGMRAGFHISPFLTTATVPACNGPECAAPSSLTALKLKPAAADQTEGSLVTSWGRFNMSARGLNATEVQTEQIKWRAALDFYNRTGVMDLSYVRKHIFLERADAHLLLLSMFRMGFGFETTSE